MAALFFPIIIAGLLYYILRPVVRTFSKTKYIPQPIAILLVFVIVGGLLYLGINLAGGVIVHQIQQISEQLPKKIDKLASETKHLVNTTQIGPFSFAELKQKSLSYLSDLLKAIGSNLAGIISAITSVAVTLVIVPFILFYLLKDDYRFAGMMEKLIPSGHIKEGKMILSDIDNTLSAYIVGQLTVAFVDGVLMYIGYIIIDLHYAAVLGLFVMVTAIIPLLGPVLGVLPAIVIALIQNPVLALYVLVLVIVVQQLEGNLVSPLVLGKRLDIHPLSIILLLIVAGALYGFIGILIAIPLYAVLKVTIKNFYKLYQLHKDKDAT